MDRFCLYKRYNHSSLPTYPRVQGRFYQPRRWPKLSNNLLVWSGVDDHVTCPSIVISMKTAVMKQPMPRAETPDRRGCKVRATCPLSKRNKERKGEDFRYPTRIPRTIMVGGKPFNTEHKLNEYKHMNQSSKRNMDFTDINKACPKDCYPLPEIDWKVESLSGKGVFCYRKMPFVLKNARATYQRLVDKVFNDQIRRNLEAYVENMVIKSASEEDMLMDNQETFDRLRSVNMKLNPKKCSFDVEEGPFIGHLITKQGIKANPLKVKAITDLKQP
ncbi:hypothetical protein Tco_0857087 [Tanacetum coccineum]|uniref:Reverse transcriptase domain-containing protein n=1 Tax=Tanacetum coccineum TaxID=301880 RepID=A0ABQ5B5M1_9ASTR